MQNLDAPSRGHDLKLPGRCTINLSIKMPPHGGMSEQKANQKDRVRIEVSQLCKYFPRNYTAHQMEQSILKLLEEQYRKKQRSKDAR